MVPCTPPKDRDGLSHSACRSPSGLIVAAPFCREQRVGWGIRLDDHHFSGGFPWRGWLAEDLRPGMAVQLCPVCDIGDMNKNAWTVSRRAVVARWRAAWLDQSLQACVIVGDNLQRYPALALLSARCSLLSPCRAACCAAAGRGTRSCRLRGTLQALPVKVTLARHSVLPQSCPGLPRLPHSALKGGPVAGPPGIQYCPSRARVLGSQPHFLLPEPLSF